MDNTIKVTRRGSSMLGMAALLGSAWAPAARAAGSGGVGTRQGSAGPKNYKVKTPDGVTISVFEYGNPRGPAIVMVHGFAQCHLSWAKQLNDGALAANFRMIAYDFRGHGDSDKIMDASLYSDGARFADELNAVMDAAQVDKPLLVGWSYGTRILGDYLIKYGTGQLAGINVVGVAMSGDPKFFGPASKLLAKSFSDDFATSIEGTREFLRACFARQPQQDNFETMLDFNAMVPTKIKRWLRRPAPYEDALKTTNIPVLVSHGTEDQVCLLELGRYVASTVPGARLSIYEGAGHATFWEDPMRFNAELAAVVHATR